MKLKMKILIKKTVPNIRIESGVFLFIQHYQYVNNVDIYITEFINDSLLCYFSTIKLFFCTLCRF